MSEGLRVLVCGGREYGYMPRGVRWATPEWYHAKERVRAERLILSDALMRRMPIALIIHGNAHGADELASLWAKKNGVEQQAYPARWYPNGRSGGLDRSAGLRRNQKMLDEQARFGARISRRQRHCRYGAPR